MILAKYGMDGKRDTRPLESNSLKDHDTKEGDMFDDPRLDKLWNKVCLTLCVKEGGRKNVSIFWEWPLAFDTSYFVVSLWDL